MAARSLLTLGIIQNVRSGFQIRAWDDPWIPTIPARLARPIALVVHPRITVNGCIHGFA